MTQADGVRGDHDGHTGGGQGHVQLDRGVEGQAEISVGCLACYHTVCQTPIDTGDMQLIPCHIVHTARIIFLDSWHIIRF